MANTPNLPGLTPAQVNSADAAQWRQAIRQAALGVRTASTAFLAEDMGPSQTVTVQIAIQERVRTPTGQQWWDVPPIVNVPIMTPRGGGFSVTLPLKKGDQGMLIFCDTCFDNWWLNGQENAPKAANVATASGSQTQFEIRRHHVHDCGFYPGLWSQNNLLANYSMDSLQVRSDDGATVVDVAAGGVTITGGTVTAANGGTALPLVNDNFYQWFVNVYMPSVRYLTTAPPPPADPETTILKGQ